MPCLALPCHHIDTVSNCKMLKMLLNKKGIDCDMASNGLEAVTAYKVRWRTRKSLSLTEYSSLIYTSSSPSISHIKSAVRVFQWCSSSLSYVAPCNFSFSSHTFHALSPSAQSRFLNDLNLWLQAAFTDGGARRAAMYEVIFMDYTMPVMVRKQERKREKRFLFIIRYTLTICFVQTNIWRHSISCII